MAITDLSDVVGFRNKIFKAGLKSSDARLKALAVNITRRIHGGELLSIEAVLSRIPKDLSKKLTFFKSSPA